MKRIVATAIVLLVVLSCRAHVGLAEAAVIPMTLRDLAQGAEVCVRGQVVAADPAWTADGAMIHTTFAIECAEVLMGSCPATVMVRVPGGELDGIRIRNGEAPVFLPGEEVVAFLKWNPDQSAWTTYGWFQGKYTILDGMVRELLATSWDALRADIIAAVESK